MYALLLIGWVTGMSSGSSPAFYPMLFVTEQQCEAQAAEINRRMVGFDHRCILAVTEPQYLAPPWEPTPQWMPTEKTK